MFEVAYIIRCNNQHLRIILLSFWLDDCYRNAELGTANSHLNMERMKVNRIIYIGQGDLRINLFCVLTFLSGLKIHCHLIIFFVLSFGFHCLLLLCILLLVKHVNTRLIANLFHPASRLLTDLHLEEITAPNNQSVP